MDIEKLLELAVEEARRMWRYRLVAIGCAWLIALAGWAAVHNLPNKYVATARVYVRAETVLRPLLQGLTVPTDPMAQVELMTRALLSRPNLETVVVSTGLDARIRTPAQRDKLIDKLGKAIQVAKIPNEPIYVITYTDNNPAIASSVVQTLLDDFIARTLQEDSAQSQGAERFLKEQIAAYEQRLTQAEDKLAAFKKANMGLMPGNAGDFYGRFQAAQAAVESLQFQISAQTNRRDELARQAAGGSARSSKAGGNGPDYSATSVDPAIRRLEDELATLRLQFTDKHPDVQRTIATLQDLRNIRDEERRARATGGTTAGPARDFDPVDQQLKVALSNADAELAALQAQLRQRNSEVSYLRGMANTIPEVEAQLARLNRDYNVVKTEYETLLQRLNSLKLNQQVQEDDKGLTFRVIDPPHAPMAPIGPNRLALNSLVLLVAFGTGIALAFLLSQRDVTFYSATSLNQAYGLPVYGAIGNAAAQARARSWLFETALATLVLSFAALLFVVRT